VIGLNDWPRGAFRARPCLLRRGISYRNAVYSGVVPQISAILDTPRGRRSVQSRRTDFIIMSVGQFAATFITDLNGDPRVT
jgi:acetyl-CoA carboxylase carboxyltransferase component